MYAPLCDCSPQIPMRTKWIKFSSEFVCDTDLVIPSRWRSIHANWNIPRRNTPHYIDYTVYTYYIYTAMLHALICICVHVLVFDSVRTCRTILSRKAKEYADCCSIYMFWLATETICYCVCAACRFPTAIAQPHKSQWQLLIRIYTAYMIVNFLSDCVRANTTKWALVFNESHPNFQIIIENNTHSSAEFMCFICFSCRKSCHCVSYQVVECLDCNNSKL